MSRASSFACMFLGAEVCSKRLVEIVGIVLAFIDAGGADDDLNRAMLVVFDASNDMVKEFRRLWVLMLPCKQALVEKADLRAYLLLLLLRACLDKDIPDNIV